MFRFSTFILQRSVVRAFAFKLTGPEFNPHHRERVNFFRQIIFSVFPPLQFILRQC